MVTTGCTHIEDIGLKVELRVEGGVVRPVVTYMRSLTKAVQKEYKLFF